MDLCVELLQRSKEREVGVSQSCANFLEKTVFCSKFCLLTFLMPKCVIGKHRNDSPVVKFGIWKNRKERGQACVTPERLLAIPWLVIF